MALHINLLHEQEAQKKQAERDPLKLGLLAMIVIGMLLAGWYLFKQASTAPVLAASTTAAAAYAKLEPEVKKFETDKQSLEDKIALSKLMIEKVEDRILWAPALQILLGLTPPTAQFDLMEAASTTSSTSNIRVVGLLAASQPFDEAEKFRNKIITGLAESFTRVKVDFVTLKDSDPVKFEGTEYPAVAFEILIKLEPPPLSQAAPAS